MFLIFSQFSFSNLNLNMIKFSLTGHMMAKNRDRWGKQSTPIGNHCEGEWDADEGETNAKYPTTSRHWHNIAIAW